MLSWVLERLNMTEGEALIAVVGIGGIVVAWQVQRLLGYLRIENRRLTEAEAAINAHKAEDDNKFSTLDKRISGLAKEMKSRTRGLHRKVDAVIPVVWSMAGAIGVKTPKQPALDDDE